MSRQLHLRPLRDDDLSFADRLRDLAGWNQTVADWHRFLDYDPAGCFLAEWDEEPAGTVTTTLYPGGLAWIGMMLVDPDFRRRGIASALMDKAIESLRDRGAHCIKLDATPEGEPVYGRLGFRPEWTLSRWVRECQGNPDVAESPAPAFSSPEFDVVNFGDDRGRWLEMVARDAVRVESGPSAFGMLREGVRADYLGPVSAVDSVSGLEISRRLAPGLGRPVFWDIPDGNSPAVELARESGFERARGLTRMWLGERLVPSDPVLQFGLVDPATG